MANSRKSFGVDIEETLSESFSAQIDERGYTKYRAVEGALRAFLVLPAELQVRLISVGNSSSDVYPMLVEGLLDVELAKALDNLGPDKQEFLALVRQAKAKVSRKK